MWVYVRFKLVLWLDVFEVTMYIKLFLELRWACSYKARCNHLDTFQSLEKIWANFLFNNTAKKH